MVLGEPQILGQMKEAARLAREAGALGSSLDKLFQRAFAVAKEVRSSTEIGENIVSMAAAAVHLAERIFPSFGERELLFVGAGEMIELCLTHFAARHPKHIMVANRSVERGLDLAMRFGGEAVRLDDLPSLMPRFDVVVSSTAAPLPIIGLGLVERSLKVRRHSPIFMVDLAVPRDIEAEVVQLDDVFLYTIDDLSEVVGKGRELRQDAVADAETIISRATGEFEHWRQARQSVPLIRAMRDDFERARQQELEHARRLIARGEAPGKVLETFSRRLTNKLLHAPSQTLNEAVGEDRENLHNTAARLFQLRKS